MIASLAQHALDDPIYSHAPAKHAHIQLPIKEALSVCHHPAAELHAWRGVPWHLCVAIWRIQQVLAAEDEVGGSACCQLCGGVCPAAHCADWRSMANGATGRLGSAEVAMRVCPSLQPIAAVILRAGIVLMQAHGRLLYEGLHLPFDTIILIIHICYGMNMDQSRRNQDPQQV